ANLGRNTSKLALALLLNGLGSESLPEIDPVTVTVPSDDPWKTSSAIEPAYTPRSPTVQVAVVSVNVQDGDPGGAGGGGIPGGGGGSIGPPAEVIFPGPERANVIFTPVVGSGPWLFAKNGTWTSCPTLTRPPPNVLMPRSAPLAT